MLLPASFKRVANESTEHLLQLSFYINFYHTRFNGPASESLGCRKTNLEINFFTRKKGTYAPLKKKCELRPASKKSLTDCVTFLIIVLNISFALS